MRETQPIQPRTEVVDVLSTAAAGPVVLLNGGQPRAVVVSAEEFRRLKSAAGEPIPSAALPRQPEMVHVGIGADPLGYDERDPAARIRAIAADAVGMTKRDAIAAEAARARVALRAAGLLPRAKVPA